LIRNLGQKQREKSQRPTNSMVTKGFLGLTWGTRK
jgi:hypothetical protein